MPTSAEEYRKKVLGHDLKLPSGATFRLRRLHVFQLVKQGAIPDPLSAKVMGMIDAEATADAIKDKLDPEEITKLLDLVTCACALEPAITGKPSSPDELDVSEVAFEDKLFIWQWAQGGSADLNFFREQQKRAVEIALGSQGVQPAAKQPRKRKK